MTPQGRPPLLSTLSVLVLSAASLIMLSRLVGCHTGGKPNKGVANTSSSEEPAELLRKTIAKYKAASVYRDRGRLVLSYKRDGRQVPEQSWDWAVQFVRPGKIKVDAYNLHLASEAGGQLVARVEDAESNNVDQQVVVRPAPGEVSINALATDQILFSQLIGRIQRPPVQMELLLGEQPLSTLFASNVKLETLSDDTFNDQLCHRVQAIASEGKFVFWIDAHSHLLRRLDYPVEALLPDLAADPQISEARLFADLSDATLEPEKSKLDFTLEIQPGSKVVRSFVPPPLPLEAIPLGKRAEAFEFSQLGGKTIEAESVAGKPTALFWYAHHPVCEKPAKDFAAIIPTLDVHSFAICTEPPEVSDKAVFDQMVAWKVKLNPARDLKDYRSRLFRVTELPAITLLDAEGKIQWIASGPQSIEEFPTAVARLQNGEDLAGIALEEHKQLIEQYRKLVAAGGPAIATGVLPASQPARLKLTPKWKLEDLPTPSGLAKSGEKLLVVAGPGEVWEVTSEGEIAAKHKLQLPEKAAITSIRSFKTNERTFHAVFTPMQPGVYLYDADWKLQTSYPTEDPIAVRDVQFGDLDADGQPEVYVAFAGTAGLHAISPDGKRLWTNRTYAPLVSVALSHEIPGFDRLVYVTGRGGVCGMTAKGEEPPTIVSGWSVAHLFTSKCSEATQAKYLAVGAKSDGLPHVIGLDDQLAEKWNYPLPAGAFEQPVDFVTSGKIRQDSQGEWVIAWADGAVHFVSEAGDFDDMFHTGEELRGVELLTVSGQPRLIVSTAKGLVCWEVGEVPQKDE